MYNCAKYLQCVLRLACFPRSPAFLSLYHTLQDVSCPWVLKGIVQTSAKQAHTFHMNNYHRLFEKKGAEPNQ